MEANKETLYNGHQEAQHSQENPSEKEEVSFEDIDSGFENKAENDSKLKSRNVEEEKQESECLKEPKDSKVEVIDDLEEEKRLEHPQLGYLYRTIRDNHDQVIKMIAEDYRRRGSVVQEGSKEVQGQREQNYILPGHSQANRFSELYFRSLISPAIRNQVLQLQPSQLGSIQSTQSTERTSRMAQEALVAEANDGRPFEYLTLLNRLKEADKSHQANPANDCFYQLAYPQQFAVHNRDFASAPGANYSGNFQRFHPPYLQNVLEARAFERRRAVEIKYNYLPDQHPYLDLAGMNELERFAEYERELRQLFPQFEAYADPNTKMFDFRQDDPSIWDSKIVKIIKPSELKEEDRLWQDFKEKRAEDLRMNPLLWQSYKEEAPWFIFEYGEEARIRCFMALHKEVFLDLMVKLLKTSYELDANEQYQGNLCMSLSIIKALRIFHMMFKFQYNRARLGHGFGDMRSPLLFPIYAQKILTTKDPFTCNALFEYGPRLRNAQIEELNLLWHPDTKISINHSHIEVDYWRQTLTNTLELENHARKLGIPPIAIALFNENFYLNQKNTKC